MPSYKSNTITKKTALKWLQEIINMLKFNYKHVQNKTEYVGA